MDWEFGISRRKCVCREWINIKALLYGAGNCTQYPVMKHHGKEYEKDCVCVCVCVCVYE